MSPILGETILLWHRSSLFQRWLPEGGRVAMGRSYIQASWQAGDQSSRWADEERSTWADKQTSRRTERHKQKTWWAADPTREKADDQTARRADKWWTRRENDHAGRSIASLADDQTTILQQMIRRADQQRRRQADKKGRREDVSRIGRRWKVGTGGSSRELVITCSVLYNRSCQVSTDEPEWKESSVYSQSILLNF